MNIIFFEATQLLQHPEQHPGFCPALLEMARAVMAEAGAVAVLLYPVAVTAQHARAWQWIAASLQLPIIGQTDGRGGAGEQVERWMQEARATSDLQLPQAQYAVLHAGTDWLDHQRERWVQLDDPLDAMASFNQLFAVLGIDTDIHEPPDEKEDEPDAEWARDLLTRPVGSLH